MDIGVFKENSYQTIIPYPYGDGGEEVTIEYLPLDENMAMRKPLTTIAFIKGRQISVFDDVKHGIAVAKRCVKDWSGFKINGEEAPCTPENVEMVARKDYDFPKFVLNACTNMDMMKAMQKVREEREKNSGDTSGQGKTSPACPAPAAKKSRRKTK